MFELIRHLTSFVFVAFFASFSLAAQDTEALEVDQADTPLVRDKWLFSMKEAVSFIDTLPRYSRSRDRLMGASDSVAVTRYFICPSETAQVFVSRGKHVLYACSVQAGDYLCAQSIAVRGSRAQYRRAFHYSKKGCRGGIVGGPKRIKGKWHDFGGGQLIVTSRPYELTVNRLSQEELARTRANNLLREEIGRLEARVRELERGEN